MSNCDLEVSVRIAQSSCIQYAPTTTITLAQESNTDTKTGTYTYGDTIDFVLTDLCLDFDDGEFILYNEITDGFAVDLVTASIGGNDYVFDASTYSTYDLDLHLANDECWYYDYDSTQWQYNSPLHFYIG